MLSTVDEEGNPSSAGVNYGVAEDGSALVLYVMTRRHLRKARNIERHPGVALVVPFTRHLLWFLPPPTIQLHGRAEILDWRDEEGTAAFQRFWIGRRILAGYEAARGRGEERVCFLKITLEPIVRTYMVGTRIWELGRDMEAAAATVHLK